MPQSALKNIKGLKPVDPEKLRKFLNQMDEVIPKILEAVEDRRSLAMEGREIEFRIEYEHNEQ